MKFKNPIKRLLCLGVIACLLGVIMPFVSANTVNAAVNTVVIPVTFDQTEARNMLNHVNTFRSGTDAWLYDNTGNKETYVSTVPLQYDYELERAAMIRAAELALYYSGTRPNLTDFHSFGTYIIGENTGAGYDNAYNIYYSLRDENAVNRANQPHRAIMLNRDNRYMGVGHCIYNGTHYWVQLFSEQAPQAGSVVDPKNNTIPGILGGNRNYSTDFKLAVDDSIITNIVNTSQSNISLSQGSKIALQDIGLGLSVTSHYPASGTSPIKGEFTNIVSANPAIVSYNSATREFTGNAVGSTNITIYIGAKNVNIPVTVTGGNSPYNPYNPVTPTGFVTNGVYRMRNIRTGEHLYTTDPNEYMVNVRYGWVQEGLAFVGLPYSAAYSNAVVRLERNGERFYTFLGSKEYYNLVTTGRFISNGVVFYAYTDNYFLGNSNIIPVYRMFYPKTGAHLWTTDLNEYYINVGKGWRQEGVAYYALRQ